jgi:hypothetical protein
MCHVIHFSRFLKYFSYFSRAKPNLWKLLDIFPPALNILFVVPMSQFISRVLNSMTLYGLIDIFHRIIHVFTKSFQLYNGKTTSNRGKELI